MINSFSFAGRMQAPTRASLSACVWNNTAASIARACAGTHLSMNFEASPADPTRRLTRELLHEGVGPEVLQRRVIFSSTMYASSNTIFVHGWHRSLSRPLHRPRRAIHDVRRETIGALGSGAVSRGGAEASAAQWWFMVTRRPRNIRSCLACTRFRRHRVRCFDGAGGGSWRGGSLRESSSLRRCA